jgi:DNA-binding response OmpR family regulator
MSRHTEPLRILIVDDEPDVTRLLSKCLTSAGRQCREVYSGEEALQVLETESFDCAVFDVMMPGMSGLDLLSIVKTSRPDMPVIVVTAVDDEETGHRACRFGADGYVVKPFTRTEMLFNVSKILESRGEPHATASPEQHEPRAGQAERTASCPVKIVVSEVVRDIRSGLSDTALMEKYRLSAEALQKLLTELTDNGDLQESEPAHREATAPGTVVLDSVTAERIPAEGKQKPVISAKEAVAAIRSGADDLALMRKYGLSAKGLSSLFRKLTDSGRITPEEMYANVGRSAGSGTYELVREWPRHYITVPLPIFEIDRPDDKYLLRDITEKGIGITGIVVKAGDSKTFIIPADAPAKTENIWLEATCIEIDENYADGLQRAGFQITRISEESLLSLKELVRSYSFAA